MVAEDSLVEAAAEDIPAMAEDSLVEVAEGSLEAVEDSTVAAYFAHIAERQDA